MGRKYWFSGIEQLRYCNYEYRKDLLSTSYKDSAAFGLINLLPEEV